jgi:hypothetical protein
MGHGSLLAAHKVVLTVRWALREAEVQFLEGE